MRSRWYGLLEPLRWERAALPPITVDSPQDAHLRGCEWWLRQPMDAVGDLEYEVTGTAFEHMTHLVIEQMLSLKASRTLARRVCELCGGQITSERIRSLYAEEIQSAGV